MSRNFLLLFQTGLICIWAGVMAYGQQAHQPTPRPEHKEDAAAVARGRSTFQSSCGFCHGNDATGARAPDLVRSETVNHDENGNVIGPIIHNGRPDKGMPAFPALSDSAIRDIAAFLHHQAYEALHSGHISSDYPLAKLLTGNAEAGKAYFNGEGKCNTCHSPTGDLAGIANKYSPIDLQQHMVYPSVKGKSPVTAVITEKDGTRYEGTVEHMDEFTITVKCQDGWMRTWPRDQVTAEVHDRLEAHRELMSRYTDADIHNLFAYLETLK